MTASRPKIPLVQAVAAKAADDRSRLLIKLIQESGGTASVVIAASLTGRFIRQMRDVRDELLSPSGDETAADDTDAPLPHVTRGDWNRAFHGAPFVRAYGKVAVLIVGHVEDRSEIAFTLPPDALQAMLRAVEAAAPELMNPDG